MAVVETAEEPNRRSLEELRQDLAELENEIRELSEENEGVLIEGQESDLWNEKNHERDRLMELINQLEVRHARLAEFAKKEENREGSEVSFQTRRPGVVRGEDIFDLSTVRASMDSPLGSADELRDRAKRFIERATFPHEKAQKDHEKVQGHIERLIEHTQEVVPGHAARHILTTGSPAYARAFKKLLPAIANGTPHLALLTKEEQRALSLTGASGGFAVPVTLDPTIIPTSNSVVNPARALARIETISGSNTWNGVSSGAITASRVAEATAATDNAPTLAQPTMTVSKAHAFVPYSYEIEGDWGSMASEIASLLQDSKDDEEGASFVTGAGSATVPQGFVTGTTNTVAAATGLTVTAANLYALEAALPPRFRPNEQFVANRGIYNVVRGIDTAGGAALWLYISQGLVTQAPTPGNTGATLLGRGAWEASAMQATVVNATKIMIVGDFRYFCIVDRIGMQIQNIPFLFGAAQGNLPTGQGGFYAYWRNYSKVLSASAFVALTGTT